MAEVRETQVTQDMEGNVVDRSTVIERPKKKGGFGWGMLLGVLIIAGAVVAFAYNQGSFQSAGPPRGPAFSLGGDFRERQAGVRAAKAERIGEHAVQFAVNALAQDRHVFKRRIELFDVRALAGKAVVQHKDRVDRFLRTGRAE